MDVSLALVAGNSFILKPSEKDPLATIFITKLFNETKAPKGLLNLINGQKDQVNKMLNDQRISAVSFVGSTNVARQIYTNSTKNGKRCQALVVLKSCIEHLCKNWQNFRSINFCDICHLRRNVWPYQNL